PYIRYRAARLADFYHHNFLVVFFFQAEDGIRDFHVTGVQTCALPICAASSRKSASRNNVSKPLRLENQRLRIFSNSRRASSRSSGRKRVTQRYEIGRRLSWSRSPGSVSVMKLRTEMTFRCLAPSVGASPPMSGASVSNWTRWHGVSGTATRWARSETQSWRYVSVCSSESQRASGMAVSSNAMNWSDSC